MDGPPHHQPLPGRRPERGLQAREGEVRPLHGRRQLRQAARDLHLRDRDGERRGGRHDVLRGLLLLRGQAARGGRQAFVLVPRGLCRGRRLQELLWGRQQLRARQQLLRDRGLHRGLRGRFRGLGDVRQREPPRLPGRRAPRVRLPVPVHQGLDAEDDGLLPEPPALPAAVPEQPPEAAPLAAAQRGPAPAQRRVPRAADRPGRRGREPFPRRHQPGGRPRRRRRHPRGRGTAKEQRHRPQRVPHRAVARSEFRGQRRSVPLGVGL
mmetsp:Transcript_5048/g.12306  ORF Transcript_5048/g.12306 Transcript_5048/m.12306 type:complete len:266 (+) Transcript_5048:2075-2872(+)